MSAFMSTKPPVLPIFLFDTKKDADEAEDRMLGWLLREAGDRSYDTSKAVAVRPGSNKLHNVKTIYLVPMAKWIVSQYPLLEVPNSILADLSVVVESRRTISSWFQSNTAHNDGPTQLSNENHGHRADVLQEVATILESYVQKANAENLSDKDTRSEHSVESTSAHSSDTVRATTPESQKGQIDEATTNPPATSEPPVAKLTAKRMSVQQQKQEHFLEACCMFLSGQSKLHTMIAAQWARVRRGETHVVEAAMFEFVATDLAQQNEQLFWSELLDVDQDFETTFIDQYYRSRCDQKGVKFDQDFSLDKGFANLASVDMQSIVASLNLPVKSILQHHRGLLKVKTGRKQHAEVIANALTNNWDDPQYVARAIEERIRMDEGLLTQALVQFGLQSSCTHKLVEDSSTKALRSLDRRRPEGLPPSTLPMSIVFGAQTHVNKHRVLQGSVNVGIRYWDRFATRLGLTAGLGERAVLERNPSLCGLNLFQAFCEDQDVMQPEIFLDDQYFCLVHLCHAIQLVGEISTAWGDMNFVVGRYGDVVMFGGERPSKEDNLGKNLQQALALHKQRRLEERNCFGSSKSSKGVSHSCLPLSRVLFERIVNEEKLTPSNFITTLGTVLTELGASNPNGDNAFENANLKESAQMRHLIPFDQMLNTFQKYLNAEIPALTFDRLGFHRRIANLRSRIKTAWLSARLDIDLATRSHQVKNGDREGAEFAMIVCTVPEALRHRFEGAATPEEGRMIEAVTKVLNEFIESEGSVAKGL